MKCLWFLIGRRSHGKQSPTNVGADKNKIQQQQNPDAVV